MQVGYSRIKAIDGWLESMRTPHGYGGPTVHWWESCLGYTGAMADWRYEGIICGYVNLFRKTNDLEWLGKAKRAADDVLSMQMSDGRFERSSFQRGPLSGGTPHEAAADVGLLELAKILKSSGSPDWNRYASAARKNLESYHISRLWSGRGFLDQPESSIGVSNKNATVIEALLLCNEVCGCDYSPYIMPAAEVIISSQVPSGIPSGGDLHAGSQPHFLITGIYTARCVSAILRLANRVEHSDYESYLSNAVDYLRRLVADQGTLFGHTLSGSLIESPVWISPSGDILRVLSEYSKMKRIEIPECEVLLNALLSFQKANGSIPTAHGFSRIGYAKPRMIGNSGMLFPS